MTIHSKGSIAEWLREKENLLEIPFLEEVFRQKHQDNGNRCAEVMRVIACVEEELDHFLESCPPFVRIALQNLADGLPKDVAIPDPDTSSPEEIQDFLQSIIVYGYGQEIDYCRRLYDALMLVVNDDSLQGVMMQIMNCFRLIRVIRDRLKDVDVWVNNEIPDIF